MVNNSTIINKMNNHLKQLNSKRRQHMEVEIKVVIWDRHKYAAGLNQLYVFFTLLYCSISNNSHVQTRLLSSASIRFFFILHHFSRKPLKNVFDILLVIFEIQEFLTCCHKSVWLPTIWYINHIGGVMSSMFTSSEVDHGGPCQVKPKTIKLVFVAFLLRMK
jgi:hypothetical protein